MRYAAVVLALTLFPTAAKAQACIGMPFGEDRTLAAFSAAFTDGARDYGGGIVSNRPGPWSIGVSISVQRFDLSEARGTAIGAVGAYRTMQRAVRDQRRRSDMQVSGCLTVGAGAQRVRFDGPVFGEEAPAGSTTTFRAGYGIGALSRVGDDTDLALYAWPQLFALWAKAEVFGDTERESRAEFGGVVGAALRTGEIVVIGADAGFVTGAESATITVKFGLLVF